MEELVAAGFCDAECIHANRGSIGLGPVLWAAQMEPVQPIFYFIYFIARNDTRCKPQTVSWQKAFTIELAHDSTRSWIERTL